MNFWFSITYRISAETIQGRNLFAEVRYCNIILAAQWPFKKATNLMEIFLLNIFFCYDWFFVPVSFFIYFPGVNKVHRTWSNKYLGVHIIYFSIFDSTICLARTDRHPNVIRTKVSVTFVIFCVFVMMIMPPTIAIFSIIIALFEAFPVRFLTYNISFYFCLFNNDTIFVMANKTYIHRFLSKKKLFSCGYKGIERSEFKLVELFRTFTIWVT